MLIPFVGQSYTQASLNVNAQRTVNFYLEMSPDGKTPLAMFPRPGLVEFATSVGTAIRGGVEFNGVGYVVSGNKFYTVTSGGTVTEEGTLQTSSGPVYFAFNGVQVMVVDGAHGYIFTLSGTTFTEIADGDYDAFGPCTFIDGYFVASVPNAGQMASSALNDGTDWDALDFATAESSPDNLVRVIAHQNELVVFGDKTIEFWYNDAGTNFPFSRYIGAEIDTGLSAAATVVEADGALFFLGSDGIVYRLQGRALSRISTHAIETALQGYSSVSGAFAYTLDWDGHKFYLLTIPNETTWVFDVSNGSWVEWSSWEGDPFSPVFAFQLGRNVIVGSGTTLYSLSASAYDDDGTTIERIRDTQTISDDQKPLFFSRLEIMMETGVGTLTETDPQVMLSWSDNGGHTFGNEVFGAAGASGAGDIGEYARRVYWNRLGQSRNRIWRVRMTDPVKWVIQGASAEITRGAY